MHLPPQSWWPVRHFCDFLKCLLPHNKWEFTECKTWCSGSPHAVKNPVSSSQKGQGIVIYFILSWLYQIQQISSQQCEEQLLHPALSLARPVPWALLLPFAFPPVFISKVIKWNQFQPSLTLMLSNFSLPWLMYPILQGYSCLHLSQLLIWSAFLKSRLMRKVILLNIGNKINLIKGTWLVSWELAFYKSVLYYIGLRFNIHFPGTLTYIFVLFLLRVQPWES